MINNFDVIIIGGGFTGLTSALFLAKSAPQLKIALLEKSDIVNCDKKRDGRAFAISKLSLQMFHQLNILEDLKPFAGIIENIKIIDGNSPFYLNFDNSKFADDQNLNCFGFVIENFYIHNCLKNKALAQNNITIICPNSYQDIIFEKNQSIITLDNQKQITTKLILACDGKLSPLRTKFNINTFQKSYQQVALVFNIHHTKPHQNIALEKFLPDGPFAVLPLKNNQESSIVWTLKRDKAELVLQFDDQNFLEQFKKQLGDYLGEIKIIDQPISYNLDLSVADQFYYQRVAFVGDSAHSIHPIAGQGFNLGVGDIIAVTNLIKEYCQCGLDIGSETMLKKYNQKQRIEANKMIFATDTLNDLFSNKSTILKIFRNIGLGLVEKTPTLKKFFIKNAGGS
jgi:2-octaprenyl-6-methoxyphenol hydroxylase